MEPLDTALERRNKNEVAGKFACDLFIIGNLVLSYILEKARNQIVSLKYISKICFIIALFVFIGSAEKVSVLVGMMGDVDIGSPEPKATEQKKKIALTFDDGPSEVTEILLDGLARRGVKATFFLIGTCAEQYPETVKREIREGHLVGNHSYDHADLRKLSLEEACLEVEKTNQILEDITGENVEYIRPPFGDWKKELEETFDLIPVLWSVDPLDWTTENEEKIVNNVVTDVGEGDIILLHDSYISSVNAALQIIDILQKEGYEFVTVEELILN